MKDIQNILEFLKQTPEVPSDLLKIAEAGDIENSTNLNRAYFSSGSSKVWLENGFYLENASNSNTFGSMTSSSKAVLIGNIRTTDTIDLYTEDTLSDLSNASNSKKIIWNFKEDSKWEKNINHFVSKYNETVEVSHVVDYLKAWQSDVNFYKTLSDSEKSHPDVLRAVFQRIYDDSKSMYDEIVEWYQISPYGGEDITYYPDSVAHCFMDQVHAKCKQIGVNLTEDQITDVACDVLVKNKQMKYIENLVDEHAKLVDIHKTKDDAVRLFENYESVIRVIPQENDLDLLKENLDRLLMNRDITDGQLLDLQSKKHAWFDKLFRRNEYDNWTEAIDKCKNSIRELEGHIEMEEYNISSLEEALKPLESMPKEDRSLLCRLYASGEITDVYEGEFPTHEIINNYYEQINSNLQTVEKTLSAFKPFINRIVYESANNSFASSDIEQIEGRLIRENRAEDVIYSDEEEYHFLESECEL